LATLYRGFRDAVAAAARIRPQSVEVRALTADLQNKLGALGKAAANGARLPLGIAGRVAPPEDEPVARR
jgi:hypothetical protein